MSLTPVFLFVVDCEINPLWITSPPLFLTSDDSTVVYPSNADNSIGLNNGEIVDVVCPGGQIFVEGLLVDGIFRATCEYGVKLRIYGGETFFADEISSCVGSVATAKYIQRDCPGGQEAVIGFPMDSDVFINQIYLCFNKHNQTTLFTSYDLVPWKSSFKTKPRFPIEDEGFFDVGSQVSDLYLRKTQRKTINALLGLPAEDKNYIKDNDQFLARGHIAAAADFFYPVQINATYRYVNMAPQWQCINSKNWNQVEIDSRDYANEHKITLQVWAGTYGIATLPHSKTKKPVPLYLYVNDSARGLPVPALFWKLLFNPESKRGVVLIVHNNPYILVDSNDVICSDFSKDVKWLRWDQSSILNGYSYACSVQDFEKVVTYAPSLDVSGLLL